MCLLQSDEGAAVGNHPLVAVVVPDLREFRKRRIVNIRELIRFELEGLTVSLAPHHQLADFAISIEALPRDSGGRVRRDQIAAAFRQSRTLRFHQPPTPTHQPRNGEPGADEPWLAAVIRVVREGVGESAQVSSQSNFELDLGIDSLRRVELFAAIEARLGVSLDSEEARCALSVGELAAAIARPVPTAIAASIGQWPGDLWPRILSKVSLSARRQRALLRTRPLAAPALFLGSRLLRMVAFGTQAHGLERLPDNGPFILAPNHQSYLDPFALVGVLPYHVFRRLFFVGATEYFETRLTASLAAQLNIVPVDPDAHLVGALQAAAFGLRAGKVLVLFPEGERSIDGHVRPFRAGVGILSRQLNVPIVPVAISGMFEIWPRNRPLDWRRCLPFSGHRVRIAVGDPFVTGDHNAVRDCVTRMWDGFEK